MSLWTDIGDAIRPHLWVTPTQASTSARKTRAVIRQCADELKGIIMTLQEDFDAQFERVQAGVQELRDEIARLADLPAGEVVDFSRLTELADALANDNVPAAPPADPEV